MCAKYNIFKKALNLSESDIRFAMAHTRNNYQAAMFLGITYVSYIKYAKRYVDSATGKTLYDLHLGLGKQSRGGRKSSKKEISLIDVLEGKVPTFPAKQLKSKVLQEGLMTEECEYCGFNERRITDGAVPLVMIWKDGDFTNHHRDNLELCCYNHYFLMYDDVFEKAETIDKKCKGYYGN